VTAYDIRKTQVSIEEIWHERGPRRAQPLLISTALAVINNPDAGRYEPDLMPFQAGLRDLGRQLARTLSERRRPNARAHRRAFGRRDFSSRRATIAFRTSVPDPA
jgi:hypothetical protein